MTIRPDSTKIENWLNPDLIEQTAQAMRSDAAAFQSLTDEVEPVWRDLPVYFNLYMHDGSIYWTGTRVTDYGKAVGQGAANMADNLEDCASTIRGMESERQDLLEQAKEWRLTFAHNPAPEPPSKSDLFFDDPAEYERQEIQHAWAESNVLELEVQISSLFQRYRECLVNTARGIDSLKNDGGETPWWIPPGFLVDAGLILVGVFFPPVAIGGAALKTIYTEYQGRKTELLEEHPELSDNEIRLNAAGHAAVAAPVVVAGSVAGGSVGGSVAGRAGAGPVVKGTVDGITGWLIGVGGSGAVSDVVGTPEAGAPATQPDFAPPGSTEHPTTVRPPLAADPTLNDPDRIHETKDYDRDGYTDPAFVPGPTGEANPDPDNPASYGIAPAEEVVRKPINWTRRPAGG